MPVGIVHRQRSNLASAKAKARQEQQHRVVTTPNGAATIATGQNALRIFRRNRLGNGRHGPAGHARNGCCKVWLEVATITGVTQERAQTYRHMLSSPCAT